jgi:hypothetical protein
VTNRVQINPFNPDAILAAVFRGTSEAAAVACRAELASLGEGPDGDRLRDLFRRMVEMLRGRAYVHHGVLAWSTGRPMSPAEIAAEVVWDVTTIVADLRRLAEVGLMEQQVLQNVGAN